MTKETFIGDCEVSSCHPTAGTYAVYVPSEGEAAPIAPIESGQLRIARIECAECRRLLKLYTMGDDESLEDLVARIRSEQQRVN